VDDVLQQLLQVNTAFLSAGPREALARLQDHFQDIANGSVSPSPADQRTLAVLAEHYLPRWLKGMPARGDSRKPDFPNLNAPTVQIDRSPLDELLARYDDVAQISAGQLSFVYKAKYPTGHENAGQDVILKVPVPNDGDSDTVWQAERHALQTLKPVRHLHIIGMNDAHVLPYPCIELEYMPGGDLAQEEGSVFEPAEAATTALLIAKAVQTAHGLGLYHHDIRPENILYDHKRQPKLSDWGMSRQASATGSVSPSDDFFRRKKINPNYAAPEQLDSRFGVSQAKTDVYQLGLLLYDMLTGFEEVATRMSTEGALNFTPSSLAEQLVAGPDIDGILERALRKSVFERITIDDFGRGLAEFLDGIWEIEAVRPTLPEVRKLRNLLAHKAITMLSEPEAGQLLATLVDLTDHVGTNSTLRNQLEALSSEVERQADDIKEAMLGNLGQSLWATLDEILQMPSE
jgi:serine/threonine protein kinase